MVTQNKTVVITGGTRGIGRAMAFLFAQNGYNVVLIFFSKVHEATLITKQLTKYNIISKAYQCDVSNYEQCKFTFENIYKDFIDIDVLINNAGIVKDRLFVMMSEQEFDSVINTNLKGVFNCTKQVIQSMCRKKNGRVINISSIAGIYGNVGQSNYACSKGALISFSKSLVKEYAKCGITINCISPGFIETDMTENIPKKVREELIAEIPSNRIGKPEEVANLALFLASENASYINGVNISIDGGLVL